MKNKLTLNEDLFTPIEIISCKNESSEEPLSAPQSSAASGMAQVINNLIVDEWDAISGYNSALETVKVQGMEHQEEQNTRVTPRVGVWIETSNSGLFKT